VSDAAGPAVKRKEVDPAKDKIVFPNAFLPTKDQIAWPPSIARLINYKFGLARRP